MPTSLALLNALGGKAMGLSSFFKVSASGIFSQGKKVVKDRKAELQKEVDTLAKEANRRLDELKRNEIESPAFNKWVENGSTRFGVKGKTYQQVQSEYWRIKNFLDAKTSTVQGAQDVLRQMAHNTGFKGTFNQYNSKAFFRLADKIRQYYEMAGDTAKSLDYQLIWTQLNMMIERNEKLLDSVEGIGVDQIEDALIEIGELNKEMDILNQYPDNADGLEMAARNAPPKSIAGQIGRIFGGIVSAIKGFFGR